jgi:hypothetical protein
VKFSISNGLRLLTAVATSGALLFIASGVAAGATGDACTTGSRTTARAKGAEASDAQIAWSDAEGCKVRLTFSATPTADDATLVATWRSPYSPSRRRHALATTYDSNAVGLDGPVATMKQSTRWRRRGGAWTAWTSVTHGIQNGSTSIFDGEAPAPLRRRRPIQYQWKVVVDLSPETTVNMVVDVVLDGQA